MRYIIILAVLFLQCCSNTERDYVKKIDELLIHDTFEGWEVNNVINYEDEVIIEGIKETLDFKGEMSFTYRPTLDDYSLQYIRKTFVYESYKVSMELQLQNGNSQAYDTLYLFKEYNDDIKEFAIGQYLYFYENGKLNNGQVKYFEKYFDSLAVIKGDNLPLLPELK